MDYLSLEKIKQQLRIEPDFNIEDDLLAEYAESAETTIYNFCQRTYGDFVRDYGGIPSPIVSAALLLVTVSYEHRTPVSMQNLSIVGYGFDMLVRPYMRLATPDIENWQTATLGSDVKVLIEAELDDDTLTIHDVDFTGSVFNMTHNGKSINFSKSECIEADNGYILLLDTDKIGLGQVGLSVTFHIPDTDYQTGYRRQVVNINPHVIITG